MHWQTRQLIRGMMALCLQLAAFATYGQSVGTIEAEATFSPDMKADPQIDLKITFGQVSDDFMAAEDKLRLIELKIPRSNSLYLRHSQSGESTFESGGSYSKAFYWDRKAATEEVGVDEVVYYLSIRPTGENDSDDFSKVMDEKGNIEIEIFSFKPSSIDDDGSLRSDNSKKITFTNESLLPNQAPTIISVDPVHKGGKITWETPKTIKYINPKGENRDKSPPSLVLLIIKGDSPTFSIPSKASLFESSGTDKDTECTYTPNEKACITCKTGEKAYFGSTPEALQQIMENPNVLTARRVSNSGAAVVANLDTANTYVAVLQYVNGRERSQCLSFQPTENLTLSEALGEGEGALKDPRCFIATAAFGSPLDEHVADFRWFRDHILLGLPGGKDLIELYYTYSPAYAAMIAKDPMLKTIARGILIGPAMTIALWRTNPIEIFLDAGLLLLTMIFGYTLYRRFTLSPINRYSQR